MAYPVDFHDAHLRHWDDAELLFRQDRWANADQLYGLSAECGLKAVMLGLGMPVGHHGAPIRQYKKHLPQLWDIFTRFVRSRDGARYLRLLPDDNPFAIWWIEDRYAHRRHFDSASVSPLRSAANEIRKVVQRARQEG